MNKKLIAGIIVLSIISIGIGEMIVEHDTWNLIHGTIVSTLCLSCIKLDPVSRLEFVFETGNGENHPEFILENLTTGIVFLEYRSDVCKACDDMAPIIKEIFNLKFEKEETLYEKIDYQTHHDETIVHFYHINLDHATQEQFNSFYIYDKDQVSGVPMFVVLTVNYDRGTIKPCYTYAYGTLGKETYDERKEMVLSLIEDGLNLYELNSEGYQYP